MANSLQLATDFLLFEVAQTTDPAAREALHNAAARLLTVGQLHRFLSGHDETERIAFAPFLAHLSGLIAGSTGLRCTVDADEVWLPGDVAQQLAIIINELAMNAAKHGYRPGWPGTMHFKARREGDRLCLSVGDLGDGLSPSFGIGPSQGLGMSIVEAIVRQLRATLEATNDHGAVFTITVPLSRAAPRISRSFDPR